MFTDSSAVRISAEISQSADIPISYVSTAGVTILEVHLRAINQPQAVADNCTLSSEKYPSRKDREPPDTIPDTFSMVV